MGLVLMCSILPDFDLLWFYFVDDGHIHHHRYLVHVPAFWGVVAAVLLPMVWRTRFRVVTLLGLAAIFLYLVLDTVAGGIMWLYPFDRTLYHLVMVPPTRFHFMISFMLHWSFLLEVGIWMMAAWLFTAQRRARAAAG